MAALDLKSNLEAVQRRIAAACRRAGRPVSEVTLIAVTKTIAPPDIIAACELGIRHIGENRVQEARGKWPELRVLQTPPCRHLIGHLQSNKAKTALELFDIIHSLDSLELAEAVSRRTVKPFPVLLEVNIGAEASKSGFSVNALLRDFPVISKLPGLEVRGLMTVAPAAADPQEVRPVFRQLRELRDKLGLRELSMGMTSDFEVAIEEGATLIRIGRAIFGERT